MTSALHFDDGEFPNSGLEHTLLIWVTHYPTPNQGPEQTVVLILDGPGEWVDDLEMLDPHYPNLPTSLHQGLYLMHVRMDYGVDRDGNVADTRLHILHYKRVLLPNRRELRDMTWDTRKGVSA